MMLFVLVLSTLFLLSNSVPIAKEHALWVREGSNISVCCSLQPSPDNEALFLIINGRRFVTMTRISANVQRYDARDSRTLETLADWQTEPLDKPDTSLCVHKSNGADILSQTPDKISCQIITNMGLGKVKEEETFTVKIYTPVKIQANLGPVTVVEGQTATLMCSATGFPDLHLKWRAKDSNAVLNETQVPKSEGSKGQLDLIIHNVTASQHGQVYICEAGTSYPVNEAPATAEFVLDVALPPTIIASTSTVYTDLNVPEELNITVTGYPVPTVQCENLEVDQGTEIATKPQGGVFQYRLRVPSVQPSHLRRYVCTAVNSVGPATATVEFTVAPSNPIVLSPSQTKYANYYLLKWKTNSGAPLVNVTLNIEEYSDDEPSGSLYPRAVQNKTVSGPQSQTIALGLHELDRMKADIWPPPDAETADQPITPEQSSSPGQNRERTVWHHLTNLTANTEHRLTMIVCNAYACGESEPYVFHTDDSKLVDAKVLTLSPRAAELIAGESWMAANSNSNTNPNTRFRMAYTWLAMTCLPFVFKYASGVA